MALHETIEHVTGLINGPPKVATLAIDGNEHFVSVPIIFEPAFAALQRPAIVRTKLQTPSANCFVGDDDTAFTEEILNIASPQAESEVQPHRMADNLGGKSVTELVGLSRAHRLSVPHELQM